MLLHHFKRQWQLATRKVFLLSPANMGGKRAKILLNERAQFDLAVKLRTHGATLVDIYSFISGLYFRGKAVYASAFAAPAPGLSPAVVITPGAGLARLETLMTIDTMQTLAGVDIHADEPRYRAPLERDARALAEAAGPDCLFVLLGSVATAKYLEPLLDCFGDRLVFPADFVGRGDMSRGGLMLRSAGSGVELPYIPAGGAVLHGRRPPKLPKLRR